METQTEFQDLTELKHLPVNVVKPSYDNVCKKSSLIEKKNVN